MANTTLQEKMEWDRLINDKRFGLEHYHDPKIGRAHV